jgi:hypothetical protein
MALVRIWFAEHPPSFWIRFLETSVKALNWVLLLLGMAVAAWSVATVVQIRNEAVTPPGVTDPHSQLLFHSTAQESAAQLHHWQAAGAQLQLRGSLHNVPWFIYAFGALGAATALTAATALLGIRLRSPSCMSSHVFFMCLLLTGQACAAVAFFMDHAWQKRLPDIDEKLKEFLAARLQVSGSPRSVLRSGGGGGGDGICEQWTLWAVECVGWGWVVPGPARGGGCTSA